MTKMTLLYCLLFCYILTIASGQQQNQLQCSTSALRKFDTTFARLITLGSSGRRFPENKQDQLKKYCDQSSIYTREIENYKKNCMQDVSKQVTSVMVYSVKNTINQLCKKDSKRLTDVIASTHCANRHKPELDKCYTELIDGFLGAAQAVQKLRIPYFCCDYQKFHKCIEKAMIGPDCTEFHITTLVNFVRTLFGNVVDTFCGDYGDSSDKCDALGNSPKKSKSQRRPKSFILPMISLLV